MFFAEKLRSCGHALAFLTVLVVLFGAGFIIKQILPAKKIENEA